jgi:hypothetical protein
MAPRKKNATPNKAASTRFVKLDAQSNELSANGQGLVSGHRQTNKLDLAARSLR